jgi:DHA2 family lincomycin resistance protein-like MFS transporter
MTTASSVELCVAPADALTGGIRSGFLCGAVISLFAVACVFFVRKPSETTDHLRS